MKFNSVIMLSRGLGWRIHESVEDTKLSTNKQHSLSLKEILKNTRQYIEDDILEWAIKKCLNGSKCNYWDILKITAYLFYYYLFRVEDKINYTNFRKWFLNNPLDI